MEAMDMVDGYRQYHRMHNQTNGDMEPTYEHYLHLPICLVFYSQDCLALFAQPFGAAFSDGFVLNTTSLHLVAENLGTVLLCLGFVNVLHENTLVFEYITLRFLVKGVVQVFVDLACFPVLPQQPPQYSLPAHPLHLRRQPRLSCTLPLTRTSMATFSLGSMQLPCAGARVDNSRFYDHSALFDELFDVCARVCVSNF